MCDDEDEIVMYCKLAEQMAEQNILGSMHIRNFSEYNQSKFQRNTQSIKNNQNEENKNISKDVLNKGTIIQNNKLVFMSQQTFNKMYSRYLQTQDRAQSGSNFENENATVDQNSSQQQTRGKGTFNRLIGGFPNI